MLLVIILAIDIIAVIIWSFILWFEQKDKEYRLTHGLPAKKYHDITDYDVTVIETIRRK